MRLIAICSFTLCIITGGPQVSFAQDRGQIQGIVRDATTEKPLRGVNITVDGTRAGTTTDRNGAFLISKLKAGTYTLKFSYIGHAEKKVRDIQVTAGETTNLSAVDLLEEAIQLDAIVVSPGSFSILGTQPSKQTMTGDDMKEMSWAEDVTRAVTRLPGIASSDYSSKFTIRGGESDEVLITVDGMELYEPFHQRDYSGGLFSIVDIETIDGIELNTGGFSAVYGNRLSGVFAMKTKGNTDGQRHSSVGLSVTNARAYSDGSFADGRGFYLVSARRGMLDVLFKLDPTAEENTLDQSVSPSFYDMMGKVDYILSPKHTVSVYALHAGDQAKISDVEGINFDKNDTHYGNSYGWVTLKSFYKPTLYSQTLLYSGLITHERNGSFNKYEPSDKGNFQLTDKRDYSFFGLKQDWNWQVSKKMSIRSGFDIKQSRVKYDYFMHLNELRPDASEQLYTYDTTRTVNLTPSGRQLSLYVSARYKLLRKLTMDAGLRYDYASYTKDKLWSPRVAMAYAIDDRTVLRGAWGYYYQSQFINNLDVNHGNTRFNRAQLAKHYVLGLDHGFSNGISLRVEGYYKDLSRVNPLWQNLRDPLEVFPEQRNDNVRVIYNGSTSKGIEFLMKYDTGGKFSWWLSYALAKAEDDIKDIEFDGGLFTKRTGKVPRLNDQRHTIYADMIYRPDQKWTFNLSWQYYKGWPRTDYTYRYQTLGNGDLHFYAVAGEYNGTLYPAFHRMDLRINRHFVIGKTRLSAFLHLINLYDHANLKKFDLDTRDDEGNYSLDNQGNYVPFRDDTYWFGLTPVIGMSWEF